jgi:hypothetical protein
LNFYKGYKSEYCDSVRTQCIKCLASIFPSSQGGPKEGIEILSPPLIKTEIVISGTAREITCFEHRQVKEQKRNFA